LWITLINIVNFEIYFGYNGSLCLCYNGLNWMCLLEVSRPKNAYFIWTEAPR